MTDQRMKPKWLDEDKVWLDLLEPMLLKDPALADRAAKLGIICWRKLRAGLKE